MLNADAMAATATLSLSLSLFHTSTPATIRQVLSLLSTRDFTLAAQRIMILFIECNAERKSYLLFLRVNVCRFARDSQSQQE